MLLQKISLYIEIINFVQKYFAFGEFGNANTDCFFKEDLDYTHCAKKNSKCFI